MRWRGRERSENVQDRRGMSPKMAMGGGGGILAIIIVMAVKFFGGGQGAQQLAGQLANNVQQRQAAATAQTEAGVEDDYREFVEVVLNDTEEVWKDLFTQVPGIDYEEPQLVIFGGSTPTACGTGQSAMGPFYCPADKTIYLDPTFFEELAKRHNAPGDFAGAYVIAHEVAHHVQNLLGDNQKLQAIRARGNKDEINRGSVYLELQADYLAGLWANKAQREFNILEEGDLEEALNAASQIGDDTLQKMATGHVDVSKFTHGSSDQRVQWFKKGLLSGKFAGYQDIWDIPYNRL